MGQIASADLNAVQKHTAQFAEIIVLNSYIYSMYNYRLLHMSTLINQLSMHTGEQYNWIELRLNFLDYQWSLKIFK